ncbi:MAG: phosphoglycerate dehydrogenase, partial [Symbiobacterium sp.]|uniref:phosphoglycerate dehydrogenase n=1 Tax=Symbiobacterium sp. TaxID=1971213 RepID=UPI0034641832
HGRPCTFDELAQLVPDIDAVVAGIDTWNEDVFKLAPKLKVIARFGVGVDNIDVAKANEYGIKVCNVPGGNANAVAEMAVGLIIAAMRQIPYLQQSLRRGNWDRFVGRELINRTVGLVGFGHIAQMVARKLQGFDVRLLAYDLAPNHEKGRAYNVAFVSLEELLRESDVISLHVPGVKATYHMIGKEQFEMMKRDAYLINTARGSVVDEDALYEALKSGRIAGAAVDVYEQEPARKDHPLFTLDNVITTPHSAAETYETYRKVSLATAQAILDVFAGREPANLVRV